MIGLLVLAGSRGGQLGRSGDRPLDCARRRVRGGARRGRAGAHPL